MPKPRTASRREPLLVGLTGGIASGKSTVAAMFAELGAVVLDADQEGKAAVVPGEPALAEIVAAFGSSYLRPDGNLDRPALAQRIFASATDRETLNRITHPRIAARLRNTISTIVDLYPDPPIVVIEAALLIEAGWVPLVQKIVVVATQHSEQVARLTSRLGLTAPQADARVRSQLPLDQRLPYAHYCVRGDVALDDTRSQVLAVWNDLRALTSSGPEA